MLKKPLLFLTLCLTLSPQVLNSNLDAIAAPAHSIQIAQRQRRSLLRFKVPGVRASRNREGGLARGSCNSQELIAVLPAKPPAIKTNQIPIELTISERPTFFVNIPPNSAKEAIFLLRNEAGNKVLLEKTLPLNKANGILTFTLPADFPGLEVGKKYRWRFSLICDANDSSGNPRTSGWIERVQPSAEIAKQLQAATARDKIAIYADNGYWQDTLKALVDLRAANPNDKTLESDWVALFQSAGLNSIANIPLIQLNSL